MARGEQPRAHGPYRHGNRWRVICTGPSGRRSESFATEAEAREFVRAFRASLEAETAEGGIRRYKVMLERMGRKDLSVRTIANAVARLVPAEMLLEDVTPARARRLYDDLCTRVAVDTHRSSLMHARAMWSRLGYKGKANPWSHVTPAGVPNRGKAQFTLDEARRFTAACLDSATPGAIAALTCLALAMRTGEVVAVCGRDIDDGGRLLHVWRGKTANARRSLEVPSFLRPHLQRLAEIAGPTGRLWPKTANWIGHQMDRLCTAAKVPRITPHGLRGTHATLAMAAHATAHLVAAALGHSGPAVTRQHYMAPGAEESAAAARVGTRIDHLVPN